MPVKTLCVIHEAIGDQGAIARVAMGGVRIALEAGWRVSVAAKYLDASLVDRVDWLKLYVPPRGFALKWMTAGAFIRRALGDRRFDVVHAHQPQAAATADVFQCHYLTRAARERECQSGAGSLRAALSRAQERLVVQAEDRCYRGRNRHARMLFNSGMTRADFHRLYGQPERGQDLVLPCPAALAPSAEQRRSAREKWAPGAVEKTIIGFLGGTQQRKGFRRLLDAVAADENLLILFGGPGTENFIDARLGARCRGVGYVKETAEFYAACDVLAVPSHYEPLGLVAFEAAAHGVPVIATDEVGAQQYLLQHGAGARWDGREALGPIARRMVEHRVEFAAGCARLALQFSESRYAAQLLECYESVLKERNERPAPEMAIKLE